MPEAVARWVDLNLLTWLKTRERKVLLITAAAQLVILVGTIALRTIPLITGRTVLVRVVPVDPRDLFRGDYVRLSYNFSRASGQEIEGFQSLNTRVASSNWSGRTVYASLVPDSDGVHWRMEKLTVVKPATGLFLKGQTSGYGSLEFGIEDYYLQQGTGREYEEAIRDRKLTAEVAVTSGGHAALRALRIE